MKFKIGDTVKLVPPFGLDEHGRPNYPDIYDIGKYGTITERSGKYFTVNLFQTAKYAARSREMKKITFIIRDKEGNQVFTADNLDEAMEKLDQLMKTPTGYWYVFGDDDLSDYWASGGVTSSHSTAR